MCAVEVSRSEPVIQIHFRVSGKKETFPVCNSSHPETDVWNKMHHTSTEWQKCL